MSCFSIFNRNPAPLLIVPSKNGGSGDNSIATTEVLADTSSSEDNDDNNDFDNLNNYKLVIDTYDYGGRLLPPSPHNRNENDDNGSSTEILSSIGSQSPISLSHRRRQQQEMNQSITRAMTIITQRRLSHHHDGDDNAHPSSSTIQNQPHTTNSTMKRTVCPRFWSPLTSVVILQTFSRMILARQRYRFVLRAAVVLQSRLVRARKALRRYREVRNAILVIQVCFRDARERSRRREEEAVVSIQKNVRRYKCQQERRQIQCASVLVQAYMRRWRVRNNYLRTVRAAVTVGRIMRGWIVKVRLIKEKKEQQEQERIQQEQNEEENKAKVVKRTDNRRSYRRSKTMKHLTNGTLRIDKTTTGSPLYDANRRKSLISPLPSPSSYDRRNSIADTTIRSPPYDMNRWVSTSAFSPPPSPNSYEKRNAYDKRRRSLMNMNCTIAQTISSDTDITADTSFDSRHSMTDTTMRSPMNRRASTSAISPPPSPSSYQRRNAYDRMRRSLMSDNGTITSTITTEMDITTTSILSQDQQQQQQHRWIPNKKSVVGREKTPNKIRIENASTALQLLRQRQKHQPHNQKQPQQKGQTTQPMRKKFTTKKTIQSYIRQLRKSESSSTVVADQLIKLDNNCQKKNNGDNASVSSSSVSTTTSMTMSTRSRDSSKMMTVKANDDYGL